MLRRRSPLFGITTALVGVMLLATPALAGAQFSATLSGAQEVPPADPDGSGSAVLRINQGQGEICYELTVTNIAPATAAHIHNAPAGLNGPVVVGLAPPTGGSSSDCVSVDKALAKAIAKNPENYYINVHNATYPGGAVRGQLSK